MMHTACPKGGGRRFCWAVLLAFVGYVPAHSSVEAATCVPSAEAIHKTQPNARPKWTYGPKGERCWYAGQKPVFAKAPLQLVPSVRKPAPWSAPRAASEPNDKTSNPVPQPWALERRWAEIFKYSD
jgi:hypothetical protein